MRYQSFLLIGLLLLAGLMAAATPQLAQAEAANSFSADEKAKLEAVIHDYLLAHPEVVIETINKYQAKQANGGSIAQGMPEGLRKRLYEQQEDPSLNGGADSSTDIVLIEFFDYQCPYCKQVYPSLASLAQDDPKVKIIFKELPILGPASAVAARAAMAASRQGKYHQYHGALMAKRGKLDDAVIFQTATDLGLDIDQLRKDMDDPTLIAYLNDNLALAQEIGLRGTPAFIMGDQLIPGAIDAPRLKELIANQRASGQQ